MIGVSSVVAGVLVACSVYLVLSRNLQLVALGFLLLSNGVNVLVLASAGLPPRASPPILDEARGPIADPLPQAFLLTAIVIGLGMGSFLLAFVARTARATRRDVLDAAAEGESGEEPRT